MPTNYPTSIDAPTDPTSSNPMNAPSHSGQHTNANDAIVAIETFLGTASAPNFAKTTSPTFVGIPLTPTPTTGANTTQVANATFVTSAVATETTNRTVAVALKANIASPAFTGVPTAPTATVGTNTTQLATTAFVLANAGTSGEFEGTFVYDIRNYGTVDPTGSADSTAAILAALAACAASANGGIVWLGPGTFKISSTLSVSKTTVSIMGAGVAVTTLQHTSAVTGSVLYVHTSPFSAAPPYVAGRFTGFTIDGTNSASGGIKGLDMGDIVGATLEIASSNFRGTNGIGIYMNNLTGWCEDLKMRVAVNSCTVGCVFTVNGGYNSFGYGDIDIFIAPGDGTYNNETGIQIYTSALIYHGKFTVRGGVQKAGCIGLQTIAVGSDYGGLQGELLDIAIEVETNDSGIVPIKLDSFTLFSGSGIVDTNNGNYTANSTVSWQGGVNFNGWWGVNGFTPGLGAFSNPSGYADFPAGTNTSGGATATAPTFVSGTGQVLNANVDTILYIEVTTAASLTVSIGPSLPAGNHIITAESAALGLQTIRVPAGWYATITGTIADLNINAVSC